MASKTAKTLSAATALAALAGGFFGAGSANAQLSSAGPNVDINKWVQMGWETYTGTVLSNGSGFLLKPAVGESLPADQAKAALAQPLAAKEDNSITLSFNDGRLSYFDGCNSGGASYSVDKRGAIKVGNLAETMRLCDPTTANKADELKAILRANPQVRVLDDDTVALAAQGKMIEFVKTAGE